MLTWLNVFVNNLSQPLFWFTLVGLVFCFVIGILSLLERRFQGKGSIGYATSQRRLLRCIRSAVMLSILYVVIAAVPKADYQVQIKEVPVTQYVDKVEYKIPTTQQVFKDLYNNCMGSWSVSQDNPAEGSNEALRRRMETCGNVATQGMHANDNVPAPANKTHTATSSDGTVQVDVKTN
jgi:hypothetical protein